MAKHFVEIDRNDADLYLTVKQFCCDRCHDTVKYRYTNDNRYLVAMNDVCHRIVGMHVDSLDVCFVCFKRLMCL